RQGDGADTAPNGYRHLSRPRGERAMFQLLGPVTFGYLALTGVLTGGSVMARGLMRAGKHLLAGDCDRASLDVLAAPAARAVLVGKAAANLVGEVVHGANELSGDVLESRPAEPQPEASFLANLLAGRASP